MNAPDVIPPALGIPAALLLWATWAYLKWADRRATNHQNGSQR